MKKILLYIIVLTVISLNSCTKDHSGDDIIGPPSTKGVMEVEVITDGALQDDYVRTVRFMVFDNASTTPTLDINEIITLEQDDQDASSFKTILKVSSNEDKMLSVVINEPAAVTSTLSKITSPESLEDLTFRMADAFNANHTAPLSTGLPMTGVKRKISVTKDNNSEANAAQVDIAIERSVARVELWLEKENAVTSAEVNTSTKITLSKSHNLAYLVAGTEYDKTRFQGAPNEADNFGHMMTVANPSQTLPWTSTRPSPLAISSTPQLICSFYIPERTCSALLDADKLNLKIEGIGSSSGLRSAETILKEFVSEKGSPQTIDILRRNNVYIITGTIRANSIVFNENTILPWKDAKQGVILDRQFFLNVTPRDKVTLSDINNTATITVETNYNRTDRGFPKGIQYKSEIKYYDKNGTEISSSAGDKYGWLDVQVSGVQGDLLRKINLKVTNNLSSNNKGCYATVTVHAGNLDKTIMITR